MIEEDVEFSLKIIIVGNGRVGKSTLITRFAKGIYLDEYKKTLGVAFLEKKCYIKSIDKEVSFHLWDTAGQEEYDELTREYYKGSAGCILAFSTTDRDSYFAVEKWKKKVEEQCGNIPMIIVQTKLDLESTNCKVTESEAFELADRINLTLFRISTKNNLRIKDVFEYLTNTYCTYAGMNVNVNPSINKDEQPEKEEIKLGEIKKKENNKKESKKPKEEIPIEQKEEIPREKPSKEDNSSSKKESKKSRKSRQISEAEENERQNEILRKNLDGKKGGGCFVF